MKPVLITNLNLQVSTLNTKAAFSRKVSISLRDYKVLQTGRLQLEYSRTSVSWRFPTRNTFHNLTPKQ